MLKSEKLKLALVQVVAQNCSSVAQQSNYPTQIWNLLTYSLTYLLTYFKSMKEIRPWNSCILNPNNSWVIHPWTGKVCIFLIKSTLLFNVFYCFPMFVAKQIFSKLYIRVYNSRILRIKSGVFISVFFTWTQTCYVGRFSNLK